MIENQIQDLKIIYEWDSFFVQISKIPEVIVPYFIEHFELFLIIGENLFTSENPETLVAIHKILLVLTHHNFKYFEQIDLFIDDSMPKHFLGKLVKILLFSKRETTGLAFNKNLKQLLLQIDSFDYSIKKDSSKLFQIH